MRLALSTEGVRRSEETAVRGGTSLAELMERAGATVASEACALAPTGPIVVVCGSGNNGGDGWVAARLLAESGRDVSVLALASPDRLPAPARDAALAAVAAGVGHSMPEAVQDVLLILAPAALVVDAVLGIGTRGAPREPVASVLAAIDDAEAPVLAVDLPSGVDADTGSVPGAAVHADVTVAFGAPKAGLLLYPGAAHAGEIVVADIGLAQDVGAPGSLEVWDWPDLAFLLPIPEPADDKGSRGRVLIAGGSPGLTGAVCLSAAAALRSGAGYVTVAVPEPCLPVVEAKLTVPVKTALPVAADGGLAPAAVETLAQLGERADAVVLGPGLGRAASTRSALGSLFGRLAVPLVVDADALWLLDGDASPLRGGPAARVVTPHAGEAARLLGITHEAVLADRPAAVRALAGEGVVCVLKGARTLVSDGERVVVNMTGGPGLATLGTGDVLAGIIGTLLAQGLGALEAAVLGAHLHGSAGDAAADALTPVCCTAEDVLTYLPEAVRSLLGD